MSNVPDGTEYSKDSPWNQEDYEYNIIDYKIENGYMVVDIVWEGNPPDDEIYFPSKVRIDLENIFELIDKKLGR